MLRTVNLKGFGKKHQGKVRDFYVVGSKRILITTDRISAFDRVLGYIPYKGQVLNRLSAFWFDKTSDIIDNQVISIPHPNVTIAKNAKPIQIEMVVRGYITGVTGTSIWGSYEKGERIIYGVKFPDGLSKNQKLPKPVITPTTKAESGHDKRLTRKQILDLGVLPSGIYEQMEKAALALFKRGQEICDQVGIILVDTKYEFGLLDGKLILIDEIHTPDSSRFWIKKTYQTRLKRGLEPENFDKEFLRLWYKNKGYVGEGKPPRMSRELVNKVAKRYLEVFEHITGQKFIPDRKSPSNLSIKRALNKDKKIIGITGPIGSGKTTASKVLQKNGYTSFTFSDIIKEKLRKMGKPTNIRSILQDMGDSLRRKYGNDILAKHTFKKAKESNLKLIIIDGIRNHGELSYIKNKGGFIIGINSDIETRFKRLSKKDNFYYGKTRTEFEKDEKRDRGVGQKSYGQHAQECLEASDIIIENNGSLKEFEAKIKKLISS